MSLAKQAKTLTKPQMDAVLGFLNSTRQPQRNRLIFLLSVKAGLRAKEIASLKWSMVTDAEGRLNTTPPASGKISAAKQPLFKHIVRSLFRQIRCRPACAPVKFVSSKMYIVSCGRR